MRTPPSPELAALADRPEDLAAHLADALAAEADPEKAATMQAYIKGRAIHFGLNAPRRKEIGKPYIAALGRGGHGVVPFAHACFDRPQRELHHVAIDALRRWKRALRPENLDDLRHFVCTHTWWDTVDALAAHPVGHLVRTHPELSTTMDAWVEGAAGARHPGIDDDALWLARTGLLHQLTYKADTDVERLFRYVLATCHSKEFFLRKAQGWALRTYGQVDPDAVRTFVVAHETELSGLTRREAMKHL